MNKKLQLLCVIYLLAWMICPPLNYGTAFRVLSVISCVLWFFLEFLNGFAPVEETQERIGKSSQTFVLISALYILMTTFISVLFADQALAAIIYGNLQIYILILMGIIASRYIQRERWDELITVFKVVVVFAFVFSITSIFRSSEFYEATRAAGGNTSDDVYYSTIVAASKHGVGSFGFFCFTAVLVPILVYVSRISRRHKGLYICAAVICEIGVASAGYTLALAISAVGIICMAFVLIRNRYLKFFFLMAAVLLILFGADLLNWVHTMLAKLAAGTMYENKVNDIFAFLLNGDSQGSFESRAERYLISLKAIADYPVFGSYIFNNVGSYGNHSSILDTFALYGWGAGLCWLYIIVIYHMKIMSRLSVSKKIYLIIALLIVLTATFNTFVMTMGALYFVIPAIAAMHQQRSKEVCE